MTRTTQRTALVAISGLLGVTVLLSGAALVTGLTRPDDRLFGSLFLSYAIPGFTASTIVGSIAIVAMWMLIRGYQSGLEIALLAAILILGFHAVEFIVFGFTWFLPLIFGLDIATFTLTFSLLGS